ncbi:MAG: ATP synthase F1 subunit epsilon [Proteobacteria bacterium]|nr:ATP synthase F1 subunit epsilon [Pseudomonadota bacterium]
MRFEIVTPEKRIAAFEAAFVTAPGSEGDFGVLPGHAPFLSLLRPGAIVVTDADGKERIFCVSAGFVDVNPASVTVLAEDATTKENIKLDAAQARYDASVKAVTDLERRKEGGAKLALALKERDRAWAQLFVAKM